MLTALLIGWPFLAAIIVFASGSKNAKWAAFAATLVQLGATVYAVCNFQHNAEIQYALNTPWIADFGINFNVGMDGISMLMVLLANLIMPLIILSGFSQQYSRANVFYALALVMQGAMVGVFVSFDAFLYYIFWEMALIPIYFIVLIWGGNNRAKITFKFFIYTLFGSLLMLVAFIYMYFQTPEAHTFSLNTLQSLNLDSYSQGLVFWALFLAFAIKMPVFPFHTWQPDTYTTAPTQGTMLLSGIMLKMGVYSVLRWLLPLAPLGVEQWGQTAIILSIAGIVYASWIAITQKDMKRLFAYSSIAHVGLIAAGIFSLSEHGLQGSMIQMLSHGINVVGLFYVAQIIFNRTQNNELSSLGGIIHQAPKLATLFLIILLGSVALPLTNGFIGEFLLLSGVYQYSSWMAFFAGLTIIFGAVYMLMVYQRTMLGEPNVNISAFKDVHGSELVVLTIIAALVIIIGVYPKPLLEITEPAVKNLLETIYNHNITLR